MHICSAVMSDNVIVSSETPEMTSSYVREMCLSNGNQ